MQTSDVNIHIPIITYKFQRSNCRPQITVPKYQQNLYYLMKICIYYRGQPSHRSLFFKAASQHFNESDYLSMLSDK